ncbi:MULTISPECIES: NUDIX hydrolase [Desulfovibrio]|nr:MULTISPECIES: NUDIX hydrolase [Desulfovibrio]
MKTIPYTGLKNPAHSLEVVDNENRPLCIMPDEDVIRQRLPHRAVALLVSDRNGQALLTRSSQGWCFSSHGRVPAGMACEYRVREILLNDWGYEGKQISALGLIAPGLENAMTFLHLFTARLPRTIIAAKAADRDRHLLVDRDELKGLGTHFADLLSPLMRTAIQRQYLFPA